MTLLFKGDKVTITGKAGKVEAEVIHTEIPEHLPSINGEAELSQVKAIMAERGVIQLALLAYDVKGPLNTTSGGKPLTLQPGQQAIFAAALNGAGEWRDLQGQLLSITPASGPESKE
jgi:hypothetical protein